MFAPISLPKDVTPNHQVFAYAFVSGSLIILRQIGKREDEQEHQTSLQVSAATSPMEPLTGAQATSHVTAWHEENPHGHISA